MVTDVSMLKSTTPYIREEVAGSEWSGAPCRIPTIQDAG
jgi:hypothetical protein